jgi:hypothetical protein
LKPHERRFTAAGAVRGGGAAELVAVALAEPVADAEPGALGVADPVLVGGAQSGKIFFMTVVAAR